MKQLVTSYANTANRHKGNKKIRCQWVKFDYIDKWYMYKPKYILENERY